MGVEEIEKINHGAARLWKLRMSDSIIFGKNSKSIFVQAISWCKNGNSLLAGCPIVRPYLLGLRSIVTQSLLSKNQTDLMGLPMPQILTHKHLIPTPQRT